MASKGTLTIRLVGDASDFQKKFSNAESKLDKVAGKMRSIGAGLTAGVTAPLVLAGKSALDSASNFEQSAGAIESVFGDAAGKIEAFGKTAADSFGLSRTAVNETAAVLGAQLQSMGFSADGAADEVINLQQRAADMAATFGGTTKEALEAISSLMRGERDPIERYGVSLKQVDINARIAAMGLDTSTVAAQKQAEATAAMDLLMESTAATAGQFGREFDTAAGSQARLSANIDNAATMIGTHLLPVAVRLSEWVSDLVERFGGLSERTQKIILVVGGLAAALGPLLLVVGALIPAITSLAAVIAAISAPVAIVVVAIAGLVAGLVYAYNTSETFRNVVNFAFRSVADFVGNILNRLREAVQAAFNAIKWIAENVMAAFRGDWDTVWTNVKELAARALAAIVSSVSEKLNEVTGWFRDLPGRILGALGNLSNLLLGAGKRIVDGLIRGIKSKMGEVKDAMSSVTSRVRNFLPFSPAKEGPLSGSGSPDIAGAKIVQMMSDGMTSQLRNLGRTSSAVAANAVARPAQAIPLAPRTGNVTVNLHVAGNLDNVTLEQVRSEMQEAFRLKARRDLQEARSR